MAKLYVTQEGLTVIVDFGNLDAKCETQYGYDSAKVFPHSVWKINGNQWEGIKAQYQNPDHAISAGSSVFSIDGQGYAVGAIAAKHIESTTLQGIAKYVKSHMEPLLIAAFFQLKIPTNTPINLVVLHPADADADDLKVLSESVLGPHTAQLPNGEKFSWKVRSLRKLKEPVAGLQNLLLTRKGHLATPAPIKLIPGTEILVSDVGGGKTQLQVCIVQDTFKVVPLTSAKEDVLSVGIRDVFLTLSDLIRKNKKIRESVPEMAQLERLDQAMLNYALVNDSILIRGKEYPCPEEVNEAMQVLAVPIRNLYTNQKFKSGISFTAIVATGGGGGISLKHLKERVFNHDFVYPASKDLNLMRWSNVHGADKGTITESFLRESSLMGQSNGEQ